MIRRFAYFVIFSLATGPSASQFCRVLCDRTAPLSAIRASNCHEAEAGVAVASCGSGTECATALLVIPSIAKQDSLRVFSPDALALEHAALRPSTISSRAATSRNLPHRSLERRPLDLHFRI